MMPSAASFPKQSFHEYPITEQKSNTEVNKGNKISFSIDSLVGLQNNSNNNNNENNNSNNNNNSSNNETTKNIEKGNTNSINENHVNKVKLYSTSPSLPTPSASPTIKQNAVSSLSSSVSTNTSTIPNSSSPITAATRISAASSVKTSPSPVISNGPPFNSTISQPITPTPISPSLMNLRGSINQLESQQHNHPTFVAAAAAAAAMNPQFGLFGTSPNIRTSFDYHQAASAFYPWFMARQSPFVSNSFHGGHFNSPISPFLLPPYRKPKRIRTAFSPNQLLKLEQAFEKNHYVVGAERKQLAQGLNLTETQVKVWFQNRRTKHKRQKQEDEEKSDSTGSNSNNKADKGSPSHHQSDDEEEIDEDESDIDPDSLDATECLTSGRNIYFHHPHPQHHPHLHHHHFSREES